MNFPNMVHCNKCKMDWNKLLILSVIQVVYLLFTPGRHLFPISLFTDRVMIRRLFLATQEQEFGSWLLRLFQWKYYSNIEISFSMDVLILSSLWYWVTITVVNPNWHLSWKVQGELCYYWHFDILWHILWHILVNLCSQRW